MREIQQNSPCWVWWNSTWQYSSHQAWLPGRGTVGPRALAVVVDNETGETRVVNATSVIFGDKPEGE